MIQLISITLCLRNKTVKGNLFVVLDQGWWSQLNFNGSGSCSGFSKLLSFDSGAGHFSWLRLRLLLI